MGQIRKILEHLKNEGNTKYPLLKFYCNWVLHVKIDNTSPIKEILEEADADKNKGINKILDFVYLKPLRDELKKFLKEFNLPNKIVKNINKWENFRDLLHEILIDIPCIEPTDSIESFSLGKSDMERVPMKSAISWTIKYKNKAKISGTAGKIV